MVNDKSVGTLKVMKMADINLLLGLSNVVLIWITIYSTVIMLKWQFEDREKDAIPLKEKEELARGLVKYLEMKLDELEKRLETIETWLEARK